MYEQAQAHSDMNETDVREAIVRPFLHWLGYAYGSPAHIRTEFPLRYEKAFLGRKKPDSDPALRGRADYICDVVSHGRWVVEVKAANQALTIEDSQQAHTYSTHPEVAASYYLLTNGFEFKLFRVGNPDSPVLEWLQSEIGLKLLEIKNFLSPTAIKKMSERDSNSIGKPLAEGLGAKANIAGYITYVSHNSQNPDINYGLQKINGMRAVISKGAVNRSPNGLINAQLEMASAFDVMDDFNKSLGIKDYSFSCADEYISTDSTNPTIFQNLLRMKINRGTVIPALLGNPTLTLPFDWHIMSFTQAVGYISETTFKGTFLADYRFGVPQEIKLAPHFENFFRALEIEAVGNFELKLY